MMLGANSYFHRALPSRATADMAEGLAPRHTFPTILRSTRALPGI